MLANERITKAVLNSKYNAAEVARRMGIKPPSLSQLMKGVSKNLKMENLFSLADITGFSARWIATGEGPELQRDAEDVMNRLNKLEQMMLTKFNELSSEQKIHIIEYMEFISNKKHAEYDKVAHM